MNCFPSMTGGDIRDNILQMQINSELGHSLSINKIGTKTQINLLAKNGDILSTYEIPDANASNVKSMKLVDQSIVLTFSDNSSVTCSLADIYSKIDTKQDTISDLNAIREGAAKGSTAVQPEALDSYTKTRDELIDKCTVLRCTSYDPYLISKDANVILTKDVPTFQKTNLDSGSYEFSGEIQDAFKIFIVAKPKSFGTNKGLDCSDTGLIGIWVYYNKNNEEGSAKFYLEITSAGAPDYEEREYVFNTEANTNEIQLKSGWNFYPLNLTNTLIKNAYMPTSSTSGEKRVIDISNINYIRLFAYKNAINNATIRFGQIAKITPGVNEEFDYDIFTLNNRIDEVASNAKSYTDDKAISTLTSARTYTDSKTNSTLVDAKTYTDDNLEKLSADVDKKIFRILPNKDSTFIDGFDPNILPISTYEDDKTKYITVKSDEAPNDTLASLGVGSLKADFNHPATGVLFTIGSKTSSSYSISPINCSNPGIIGLWLYFEKKSTDSVIILNIEFSSSGTSDYQEIYFTINNSNIKEGWNFYKFDLLATDEIPVRSGCIKGTRTNGNVSDPDSGPFDVSAINFVRMHFSGSGSSVATKNCTIKIGPMALLTKPLNNEFAYYDDYINALIDTKLGVIENGTY